MSSASLWTRIAYECAPCPRHLRRRLHSRLMTEVELIASASGRLGVLGLGKPGRPKPGTTVPRMGARRRIANYQKQNRGRPFSDRQMRRLRKSPDYEGGTLDKMGVRWR